MTMPYMGGQPPKRPRTMQEIADSVRMANQQPGSSGRSMEEIAASVLGKPELTGGDIAKGIGRSLGQGLFMQSWDEIEGGIRSLGPDDYKTARDKVRGEMRTFEDQYKPLAIGAEVAGGIIPTVGAIMASGGTATPAVIPSLGARAARAAIGGAGAGAGTGFGAAEEMADTPASMAMGAGLGAAAGAVFPLAGEGIRRVGNKALDFLETPIRATAENIPDRPIGTQVPVLRDVKQFGAAPTVAKRLGVPVLERRAAGRAEQKLRQALIDDGLTPEEAAQRVEGMLARGAPAALADVGDENLLELTNTAYLIPGQGRKTIGEFFRERVLGASGRLAQGVETSANARMGNVRKMVTEIADERRPVAKQMYEKAYAHGPVTLDDEGTDIILTKDALGAWFEGLRRSRLEALTDVDKQPLPALYRVAKDEQGETVIELIRNPTVRDIDIIKRGFDAKIKKARAKGDKDLARIMDGARVKVLDQVDAQAPDFQAARAYWAGKQGLMDALENGKKFLRGGDDDFELAIEKLTPDERDMYRIGAANAIAESLRRREGRAAAINILTDPTARRRLQQLYPDEASWKLMADIVDDEVRMAGPFARISRQSQTAQNLLGIMDFASDFRPGDIVPDPKNMALRALFGLANAGQQRAKQSSAAQLATLLTKQGPDAVDYLRTLQPQAEARAQASAAATRASGRLGGLIGGRLTRGY